MKFPFFLGGGGTFVHFKGCIHVRCRGIDEEASTALLFAAQVSWSGRVGNVQKRIEKK